jgi:hypothetical protein
MCPDAIVVVEVLPDRPEFRMFTYPILARLRDYEERRPHLEGSWWRVGDVGEFLQLTPNQRAIVDIRVALANGISQARSERHWTHADLAKELGSSRSRVAKMEMPDSSVAIDLYVKSLLALGLSRVQLGFLIAGTAADGAQSPRREG